MSGDSLPVRGGVEANGKTSLTSAQAAAQLTREGLSWSDLGQATTVSYAFRASGTVPVDGGATFYTFNAQQIAAAELALSSWSDVANIRFVRVGSGTGSDAYSNNATILFGDYVARSSDNGAAFANYPGSRSSFSPAGDVWVASNLDYNRTPVVGDYGQQVLVHEIGHAIGLSHPSDYDASDENDPTYATNAAYYEDARQYTVMSYFASSNTGASLGAFAAAPQIDDIAAAQRLYGANYATRAGDTTYGFNSNGDRPYYIAGDATTALNFAVWDGGGHDRFDFSGYSQNQIIDLRQGAFSDVGGWVHNVGIAVGAVIEEAIGGSGDDTLIANDNSDDLLGGLGADVIRGGAGNDHLYGAGRSAMAGDGNDTVSGGAGSDYLQGNAGDDSLSGGTGSDRLYGGQGNDIIRGEEGNDTIQGALGNDTIDGGVDNDSVGGGQGDDIVSGGSGDDIVRGGQGSDRLDGGTGLDNLTGGPGADVFVVSGAPVVLSGTAGASDVIADFDDGIDRLTVTFGVVSTVLYGDVQPSATMASIVAYAHQILDMGSNGSAALAVGSGGDTLVFTHAASGDLDAVRLIAIADPHLISVADFI